VSGYPVIAETGPHAQLLSFHPGVYMQSPYRVQRVRLRPGSSAGVIISHYRCDETATSTSSLSVVVGGVGATLTTPDRDDVCLAPYDRTGDHVYVSPYLPADGGIPFCIEPATTDCEL